MESDTESSAKSTSASKGQDIGRGSDSESSTKSTSATNPSSKSKGIEAQSDSDSITKSTGSLDFSDKGNAEDTEMVSDTESITEFTRAIDFSKESKKKPIPIGVAIPGAGPCARTKYLPAIERPRSHIIWKPSIRVPRRIPRNWRTQRMLSHRHRTLPPTTTFPPLRTT